MAGFPTFYGCIIFHYICTSHLLYPSIHLTMDLGCFYILAISSNAVMNMEVHISPWNSDCVYFGNILQSKLLDHTMVQFLIFWGTSILLPLVDVPIHIPTNKVQGLFSTSLPTLVTSCLFGDGLSNRFEVISLSVFSIGYKDVLLWCLHRCSAVWLFAIHGL